MHTKCNSSRGFYVNKPVDGAHPTGAWTRFWWNASRKTRIFGALGEAPGAEEEVYVNRDEVKREAGWM